LEKNIEERYYKVPHIGYNYKLKKYKIIESHEKMSEYVLDNKTTYVFYTPYKCVLVDKKNTFFFL